VSPRAHRLTALGLGVTLDAAWLGRAPASHAPGLIPILLVLAGTLLGARAPDVLEVATFVGGRRASVIPHRTLTHWIPLWVAALYGMWRLWQLPVRPGVLAFTLGFTAAGALHVATDFLTPIGVPLWLPLPYRRIRMPLCHTGNLPEEALVSALLIVFALAAVFLLVHPTVPLARL